MTVFNLGTFTVSGIRVSFGDGAAVSARVSFAFAELLSG